MREKTRVSHSGHFVPQRCSLTIILGHAYRGEGLLSFEVVITTHIRLGGASEHVRDQRAVSVGEIEAPRQSSGARRDRGLRTRGGCDDDVSKLVRAVCADITFWPLNGRIAFGGCAAKADQRMDTFQLSVGFYYPEYARSDRRSPRGRRARRPWARKAPTPYLRMCIRHATMRYIGDSECLVFDGRQRWIAGAARPLVCSAGGSRRRARHRQRRASVGARVEVAKNKGQYEVLGYLLRYLDTS
jgi:hypothetical protein